MRIYISGPITGQENTARFRFTEGILDAVKAAGKLGETIASTEVINPYEVNNQMAVGLNRDKVTHADYMTTSIAMLAICDTIFMMRGWEKSDGCKEEYAYARKHGFRVLYQREELE